MTQDYSFTTNAPAFRAILFALISVFSTKTFLLLWVFFSLRNFWYGAAALRVASTANLFTGPCERIRSLLRKDGRVEENFIEKHNLRFLRLYKGLKIECLFFKFQTHKTRMGWKWHKKQRADVMSLSTKKKKKVCGRERRPLGALALYIGLYPQKIWHSLLSQPSPGVSVLVVQRREVSHPLNPLLHQR